MNLKDWGKLSAEEQQAYLAGASQEEKRALIEADQSKQKKIWEANKCPAGLLELRNQLKEQIEEEKTASSYYVEAASKLGHYKKDVQADILRMMSTEEMMHYHMLNYIVDHITKECGE